MKQSPSLAGAWPERSPIGDRLVVVAAVLAMTLYLAIDGGLADLGPGWGDPDSMLRLVEVRDWLGGAGWFDLMQPRMGPDGVFMHWSRLVDVPIAGLILLADPFLGRIGAEAFAATVWPVALTIPFGLGAAAAAHALGGLRAALLTLLLLFLSPALVGLFQPGRIDHHNLQNAALAILLAGLVRADRSPAAATLAGAMAAFSLAIGLEMLPMIAVAAGGLTLMWVVSGDRWRVGLGRFGASFGVGVVLLTFAAVDGSRWSTTVCDALSPTYAVLAAVGGAGLVVIAGVIRGSDDGAAGMLVRGGSILGLASLLVTLTAVAYPECLAGPYGQVDPRLGPIFLDRVTEAQSALQILAYRPAELLSDYAAGVCGLLVAGALLALRRDLVPPGLVLLTAILAAAFAASLVQVRGMAAAQLVGAILGGAVFSQVTAVLGERTDARAAILRLGWVAMAPLTWLLIVGALPSGAADAVEDAATEDGMTGCRATFAETLGPARPGLVASTTNFGSWLLLSTPQRVLAAPYHRNTDGLVTADAIITGAGSRAALDAAGVDYVALCRADPEIGLHFELAPDGLFARLDRGETPDYLEPMARTDDALIFRVRRTLPAPGETTGSLPALRLRPTIPPGVEAIPGPAASRRPTGGMERLPIHLDRTGGRAA